MGHRRGSATWDRLGEGHKGKKSLHGGGGLHALPAYTRQYFRQENPLLRHRHAHTPMGDVLLMAPTSKIMGKERGPGEKLINLKSPFSGQSVVMGSGYVPKRKKRNRFHYRLRVQGGKENYIYH